MEICESRSNSRRDSSSRSKNSSRRGTGACTGKTSMIPPRRANCWRAWDLRDFFQPGRQKRFPELVRVVLGTYFQQLEGGSKFIRDRSGVGECLSRSDTEHRCSGSLGDMKFLEAGEALSVPVGISQFGFEIFQGRVRERNRLQTPASQFDRESLPVPGRASE